MSVEELHRELEGLFWETGDLASRWEYHMEMLGLPPDFGLDGKLLAQTLIMTGFFILSVHPVIGRAMAVVDLLHGDLTGLLDFIPGERIAGAARRIKGLARRAGGLLAGPIMRRILTNIDEAAETVNKANNAGDALHNAARASSSLGRRH